MKQILRRWCFVFFCFDVVLIGVYFWCIQFFQLIKSHAFDVNGLLIFLQCSCLILTCTLQILSKSGRTFDPRFSYPRLAHIEWLWKRRQERKGGITYFHVSSKGCQYWGEPIRKPYIAHVTKMDSRIFTFHSRAIFKTAEAPEH